MSKRALCLPFYDSLDLKTAKKIAKIVNMVIEETQEDKPTLTIGIPAHNEERNIKNLVESIFRQTTNNFKLEKILVVLDGCTDNTAEVVKGLMVDYPLIELVNDQKRKGKISRLNLMYQLNKSDYILTLDGDLVLDQASDIDEMFEAVKENPRISLVAGNLVPLKREGFWGELLFAHQTLWDELRYSLNGGDHIANSFGCANLLSRDFSKSIDLPTAITCDEEYLYVVSKRRNGFKFARNTAIKYIHAANLSELRLQTTRFLNERSSLIPFFGADVVKLHEISLHKKNYRN